MVRGSGGRRPLARSGKRASVRRPRLSEVVDVDRLLDEEARQSLHRELTAARPGLAALDQL
ncbi:MAG: hypothetical protein M0Z42_09100, partial [Actinomycetota bacterium]|nr:hypothetical protein [Actinomycetota bacterium]